jgi:xylonate dehydratase
MKTVKPTLEEIYGSFNEIEDTRLSGPGPRGRLPLTEEMLLNYPSGHLFGMTENAGMGWKAEELDRDQFVIVSTHGGLSAEDGTPIALGYHTGHWEINLLVRRAAETFREQSAVPFSLYCSDPCDGRTQGTAGMTDSLPYRNDAAQVMRRLIRSLPTRSGAMGISACDKGLPAVMMALAGCADLPGIIVPGGVTLPAEGAEDAGKVQTIGARFAHDLITLDYAAEMGCRACGSSGGGCQFLGTAATSQVVAEALGMALPHSALAPSGEPILYDMAHRSALALLRLHAEKIALQTILTRKAVENAMLLHAAFGGSTNLLLHIPAIAHAAGLQPPTLEDWNRVNRSTPRLVDALPNGPRNHPTVHVFMAGGVPEVMLHLRDMGLLNLDVMTVTGRSLEENLDWWQHCKRRRRCKDHLSNAAKVDPQVVIMEPDRARREGLTSTAVFPTGGLAPGGSVIKATSIDPKVVGEDGVYRHRGPARVFISEEDAIAALKGRTKNPVKAGDVIVLIGIGPLGTGMEEIYQITSALKYVSWGNRVPILTDGRFSGVSTGACVGHIGPEALAGGPVSRVRDGDTVELVIDRVNLTGRIDLVETCDGQPPEQALAERPPHPGMKPHPKLPDDTRLWAALQKAGGGAWGGCVYDTNRIIEVLEAGLAANKTQ